MNYVFVFVTISGILTILVLLWQDRRKADRMRLRIKKMYASPMFAALWPLIHESKKHVIDQMLVEKRGVTLLYVQPAGYQRRFLMKENGFPLLSQEKLDALVVLLEELMPQLRDDERYRLHKKRVRLINGKRETYYTYVITNEYKNILCRAPYYRDDWQADTLTKSGWI